MLHLPERLTTAEPFFNIPPKLWLLHHRPAKVLPGPVDKQGVDLWNKQQKLSRKVREDFLARSKQGVWAHPVCMALVLASTGLYQRAPALCFAFASATVCLAVLRIVPLRLLSSHPEANERWYRLNTVLMLSCTANWGLFAGFSLWKFGCQNQDVLILLLYYAVITFGTVNVLVHDRQLMYLALILLFFPSLLGCLLHSGSSSLPYLSADSLYLIYCFVQGKKLSQLYRQQISDNYELSMAAYQDCLTGLPNRLYMNEALDTCFEQATTHRRQIALLYIDLDGFKQINDRHSHKVGDLFLREAAQRIRRRIRQSDLAARIGGDEFTILIPECISEKDAVGLAEKVLFDTREPMHIDGHWLTYSASIGVSLFPHTAGDREGLLRSADEAMYSAKKSGKSRVCVAACQSTRDLNSGKRRLVLTQDIA